MKSEKIIISGGRIIDPIQGLDLVGDLVIADGKIAEIREGGHGSPEDKVRLIDATGLVVSPGFIDLHCHLREPGFEEAETIATGTRAAARGGFTSVCAMANTRPVVDSKAMVEFVFRTSMTEGKVRVFPVAAVSVGQRGEKLVEMGELAEAGVVAFSDDGHPVASSRLMRYALEYAGMFGKAIVSHCEDVSLSNGGVMNEGLVSTQLGLKGAPRQAEEIMVSRDLEIARETGGRLHVAHISTAAGVELIREAKKRGTRVTAEVTPHHLLMTEDWVRGYRPSFLLPGTGDGVAAYPYDGHTKVNPPLRTSADNEALLAGLKDGTVDAIATDHAPHTKVDKECEFDLAPFGISGFETALGVMMTLVGEGKIGLADVVTRLTAGPARVLGLPLGSLRPETPADVTIFDPAAEWVVEPDSFVSKGRNTPLAGCTLKGQVVVTIVGGEVVYER